MNIGKKFVLIEMVADSDLNRGSVHMQSPNADLRQLKVAKVIKLNNEYVGNMSVDDIVVVDDTFITYWLDDTHCCITEDGILCLYDITTFECLSWPVAVGYFKNGVWQTDVRDIVVKASIPDNDTVLRNTFVQNGLVIIGGMQQNRHIPKFDNPVAITASPDSVKHLVTLVGDYYITTTDNLIMTFDLFTNKP